MGVKWSYNQRLVIMWYIQTYLSVLFKIAPSDCEATLEDMDQSANAYQT